MVWHSAELDRLSGAKEIASGVACGSEHCVCLYQKKICIFDNRKFYTNVDFFQSEIVILPGKF